MKIKTAKTTAHLLIITAFLSFMQNSASSNDHLLNEDQHPPALSCRSWSQDVWNNHKSKVIGCTFLMIGGFALIAANSATHAYEETTAPVTNATALIMPQPHGQTPKFLTLRDLQAIQKIAPNKNPIKQRRAHGKKQYR